MGILWSAHGSGEQMMPPWLLRSRVTPPRYLDRLIARRRVQAHLERTEPGSITWVCAPPGFGKSVALSEWYSTQRLKKVRVAWFNCDTGDDPAVVVAYLAFACSLADAHDQKNSALLEAALSPVPPTLRLQTLLGALERSEESWLLVIDDVDRASETVVRELFEPLTRFMPANLNLAFGTRDPGSIDLSAADQRGVVEHIGIDELRLTRDEIRELWGRTSTDPQLRAVEQRSDGWPALLQLLLHRNARPRFLASVASEGGGAAVCAFFETRLLARLDRSTRKLLLTLALLDHFTAGMAQELSGFPSVDGDFEQLLALGIISHSVGEDGQAYKVQGLLRDYLARQFAAEEPEAYRRCQVSCAQLLLRAGQPVLAVRHAAAVHDDTFLIDIIEAVDPLLLGIKEGFSKLRQIVRHVPERLAVQRPKIGYACTASAIKAGRLRDAKRLFATIEARRSCEPGWGEDSATAFQRALCHSLLAVYKGTPIYEADVAALEAAPGNDSLTPMVRSLAETLRSFVQAQSGRLVEAKEAAWRAIQHANEGGSPYAAYFMYCDLGMITGLQGDSRKALGFFEHGDELCSATVRLDERLGFIRDAFRLELEHECNPLSSVEGARLKNICTRLPTLEGWLDVYGAAFRTYSEQLYLAGDLPAAIAVLSSGIDHLLEQEIEAIPIVLMAQRAMLLALAGNIQAAREALAQVPKAALEPSARDSHPWRLSEALTEAEAVISLMSGGRVPPPGLSRAIRMAVRAGNVRSEIRFRRLWEVCSRGDVRGHSANGRHLAQLEERSGYLRSTTLFRTRLAADHGRTNDRTVVVPLRRARPQGYFSDRELAIVSRLERGLSDKGIAMDLGITAHGVRYHLKRIYAKLHARNRAEARAKAQRLGLV